MTTTAELVDADSWLIAGASSSRPEIYGTGAAPDSLPDAGVPRATDSQIPQPGRFFHDLHGRRPDLVVLTAPERWAPFSTSTATAARLCRDENTANAASFTATSRLDLPQ